MTGPNHIAGGIVITGIICSLYSLNIFENPIYISVTIIGSLLPDIDHTKSIIGKAVYPLAKWLSIKFGHRTITHSLLFIIGITTIAYLLEFYQIISNGNHTISLILFFSVFSHFLLDMVTVQGIPLLYPFYRNPCVIPAKVELRINTGNLKQEGVAFFIFAFLTIFLQDLFTNGFWFTYNQKFNTIEHVNREFSKSNDLLFIDYNYNLFQKKYTGSGYVVYSDNQNLYILNDTLTHLQLYKQGLIINKLDMKKTKHTITLENKTIANITIDSINKILTKKFINNATFYASTNIDLLANNKIQNGIFFNLENSYNPHFINSLKDSLKGDNKNVIRELEYKIKLEEDALYTTNKQHYNNINHKNNLEKKLITQTLDHFTINETKNKIIELNRKIENYTLKKPTRTLLKLYADLEEIKNDTINNQPINNITISGNISYFQLPKKNN